MYYHYLCPTPLFMFVVSRGTSHLGHSCVQPITHLNNSPPQRWKFTSRNVHWPRWISILFLCIPPGNKYLKNKQCESEKSSRDMEHRHWSSNYILFIELDRRVVFSHQCGQWCLLAGGDRLETPVRECVGGFLIWLTELWPSSWSVEHVDRQS